MSIEYGSSTGSSTSGGQVNPTLLGGYNQLLGLNEGNYNNMLSAYGNTGSNLASNLSGIYPGYGQLTDNIQNTLGLGGGGWGVAAPAAEAIKNAGINQQGQVAQQMVNSGLGNTTVSGNMSNQANYYTQQAYGGLGAQLAQTYAGYQAQLGLAGLGARMQGAGMQSGLGQALGSSLGHYSYGNTMGSLTTPFGSSQNHSQNNGVSGGGFMGGGMGAVNHNDGLGGGPSGFSSDIYGSPTNNQPLPVSPQNLYFGSGGSNVTGNTDMSTMDPVPDVGVDVGMFDSSNWGGGDYFGDYSDY